MNTLELVAVGDDVEQARIVARALAGTVFVVLRADASGLPFRAMVTAVTDDAETLLAAAGVGAYVVCRRIMKPRAAAGGPVAPAIELPGVIGLFPMVRHPGLSHGQADRHWRDVHAPLALKHHVAMSHYTQLSVVHRLHGPDWDGFALCGFDSIEDLRERFFESDQGRVAIREDVARFADTRSSPRRVIVTEERYG
ncbi:MAG TPA: EthD domain-containing protein [Thermoanaerobaculia bacterium]|nr:EthD domain-containing protein [Thermoanaerobaculia bacterium]